MTVNVIHIILIYIPLGIMFSHDSVCIVNLACVRYHVHLASQILADTNQLAISIITNLSKISYTHLYHH